MRRAVEMFDRAWSVYDPADPDRQPSRPQLEWLTKTYDELYAAWTCFERSPDHHGSEAGSHDLRER